MAAYRLTQQGPQVQTAIDKSLALGPASSEQAGTMSSADKTKLDSLNPSNYQPLLISGSNIKTINGQSIIGPGNINIGSLVMIDAALSSTSTNPVQNRVITNALNEKQDIISDLSTIRANAMRSAYSYVLPSGGIPFTDLSSAVQTALGKAQTAIQVEVDPTVPAWAKAPSKPSYTLAELSSDGQHRLVTDAEKSIWNAKQAALVSGTNIKTVNNQSLLGSGNIMIDVSGVVRFNEQQTLTTEQQQRARNNIGAASLDDIDSNDYVIVTTLPTADATTLGHTYLVGPDGNNNYDRYVTQESGGTYTWIPLGSTQMDLTGYATEEFVNGKFIYLTEGEFEALTSYEEGKIYCTYEE